MESSNREEIKEEINHKTESSEAPPAIPRVKEYRIRIPSLHERLLEHQGSLSPTRRPSLLARIKSLRFSSPLAIFRRTIRRREEISLAVPSPAGIRRRSLLQIRFLVKLNFSSFLSISKEWLSHPMNAALLLWLICVAASGIMLGLLMLGMLNEAFPTKALRNRWIEINNQILNALCTLMSVYQHPALFHHLFMLCQWRSEDIVKLRKIYCKNGAHRPNEWAHMMVVIILLQVTCFAQYALCGVYWGFTSSTRPELLEYLCIALGVAAPVFAGIYVIYSPLGREYESVPGEDLQNPQTEARGPRRRVPVPEPEWKGGLLSGCLDNVPAAYLSCCCTCCVFGWNMERLGFGNMYVHTATFLLLCLAPFWIFNISALKVHDYVIGDVLGISGIVLCVFGLLYGGFWRIQMRKKFKLPENKACCGSASLTDYLQWMFCWSCALAQEVRTGNYYDVEEHILFKRNGEEEDVQWQPALLSQDTDRGPSFSLHDSLRGEVFQEKASAMAIAPARDVKVEEDDKESAVVCVDFAMAAPPVQTLMEEEDEEKGFVDQEEGPPMVKVAENGVSDEELQGSFVRMMEFTLLFIVVVVYTMGSFIVH